jgi:tRNA G46 methylase TrmB
MSVLACQRTSDEGDDMVMSTVPKYNPRKPKWWYRVSASTSKSQKRAMREVLVWLRLAPVSHVEFFDWNSIFPSENDIWIEVGFGRGENLLALAHRKTNDPVSLVGMEVHASGIGTCCQRIQKGLENKGYWTDYTLYSTAMDPNVLSNKGESGTCHDSFEKEPVKCEPVAEESVDSTTSSKENPYKNVRLWPGDGVKIFSRIPESSIAALLLTFPDPFPNDGEVEWRVVQLATLGEIYRMLRKTPSCPGRFFLATDHDGYHRWTHDCVELFNRGGLRLELVEPCPDRSEWLPAVSRYEQKGWDEGRRTLLSCWVARPFSGTEGYPESLETNGGDS